jgi:hypothetical protein
MKLIDFANLKEIERWSPINDAVMGGISESRLRFDPAGHVVFSGNVSFANNGGFASVRCSPVDLGVTDAIAYLLEVLGDGKQYKLNLRTDEAFDGVNYQCRFHPPAGIWTTCRLACSVFSPSRRGKPVPDAPPFNPAHLRQVGFMIADRQEGGFSLAIRGISVETHQE